MSSEGSEVSDYSPAKQITKGRLNANTPGSSEKRQRMDAEANPRSSVSVDEEDARGNERVSLTIYIFNFE